MAPWLVPLIMAFAVAAADVIPGMMASRMTEWNFVTRPDLRPPRLNITTYFPDRLAKGYWFVAPYADLGAQSGVPGFCQIGPHIYDGDGHLVWSGACDFYNRNSFDFKTWQQDGRVGLSFAIESQAANSMDMSHKRGGGIVLDDNYAVVDAVDPAIGATQFNFHEFSRLSTTNTTLMLYDGQSNVTNRDTGQEMLVWDGGFVELDGQGREALRWRALDHIDISESTAERPEEPTQSWDWLHGNSVDKDEDGNYLLSGRHTDCIYRISGTDGSIMWRLGGTNSSIDLVDFNFSRQHDARYIRSSSSAGSRVISFLNNAGDTHTRTSNTSAAYLVEVQSDRRAAKLLKQWPRPDGKLGVYRGNVQFLDNGDVVVHWGDHGRITEFDEEGVVLQEVSILPSHLGTYRAYKLEFVGKAQEPIMLKCSAHGASLGLNANVCHVSWNGATEVTDWEILGAAPNGSALIARARKQGFETTLVFASWYPRFYARAIAIDGSVLGESKPATCESGSEILGIPGLEYMSIPSTEHGHHKGDSRQQTDPSTQWFSRAPETHWTSFIWFFSGFALAVALMACTRPRQSEPFGSKLA